MLTTTPLSHKAVILGVPLILGVLEVGHPALLPGESIVETLTPITAWWTALHVLQIPLFALMGLAVLLLIRDLHGRSARISRIAISVFLVIYPALDSAVGVASGIMVHALGSSDSAQPFGPLACLSFLVGAAWVTYRGPGVISEGRGASGK